MEGGREGATICASATMASRHSCTTQARPRISPTATNLGLPTDWVPAGSTSGMSALSASLAPIDIESERRTVALLARYFAGPSWTLFGEFRRQEHDGPELTSASFLTEAVQFPQPFDYVTNSLETGVAWVGRKASLRLSYYGSWFDDDNDSLIFANPYLPIVPGSTQGQIAVRRAIPAAADRGRQSASALVDDPDICRVARDAETKRGFFAGQHFARSDAPTSGLARRLMCICPTMRSGLASRPLPKLSVRGNATYDGHDDKTSPLAIAYIVTDTFPAAPPSHRATARIACISTAARITRCSIG